MEKVRDQNSWGKMVKQMAKNSKTLRAITCDVHASWCGLAIMQSQATDLNCSRSTGINIDHHYVGGQQ